jgi:hypothetical protein
VSNVCTIYEILSEYAQEPVETSDTFKVGDKVKISKKKKTFEKAYWTDEIFTIS